MKRWVLLLGLLWALTLPVSAAELPEDYLEGSGVDALEDALPEEAASVLEDYSFLGKTDTDALMARLWDKVKDALSDHFSGAARSAVTVLLIVMLCSLAGAFFPDGKAPGYVTLGGVAAIVSAVITDVTAFIRTGTETLYAMNDFSTILLPCLAGVTAAGGAVTSAAAKYAAAMLFMNIMLTVCTRVIVPLVYVYLACIIAHAAFESSDFSAMAGLVKWLCMTALTVLVVAFTAYLSISGLITSSGDVVSTRFAKAAISTALPVVGKMVSDAAATVVAGVGVLRSTIGVFGMIVVVCLAVSPFLSMGLRYLLFKAAAAGAAIFPDRRFSGLIDGIGTAFGILVAMTGTGACMLLIAVISFVRAVSG